MSFRNSPWSGRLTGFFIYTKYRKGVKLLFCDINKEKVFAKHAELESNGVVCWVENEMGEKIS